MYVQFAEQGSALSWNSTAPLPIVPGESTNFIVAGMLPDTTYLMRHVLNDGTTSAPLTFTTGSLPTTVKFPTFSVPQALPPGTDPTQDMILHAGLVEPAGTVSTVATDLSGNIVWYYDSVTNNFPNYATSLVPGGTVFLLGGNLGTTGGFDTVRQIDLAGDSLRETGVGAINAELAAMGQQPISQFDHEIQLLPNGDTAVLATTPRTINVNGTPTLYNGTKVLVLDQNFQVKWAWDAFNWLDTSRLGTAGEGPDDWLHANAISWSPEDGDLLVSLRAQDWVIKIDYANGAGDGHIVWRLGQGGDFSINSSDPYPWFTHQHDVRYINDTTLVVFDDGNTRHLANPNADSRGQEWVLNETTMQATLVVNADLGNYSSALGGAQMLPDGNLAFTSGLQSSASGNFGQSIEVLPNGAVTYVQTMSGLEYRSYFLSTLYGPLDNLLNQDASTQGTWIGAYGAQGYDIVAGPVSLPAGDTVTPSGQSTFTWTTTSSDPRALQVPGSSNRVAAVWYSTTGFSVDVNLGGGLSHDLELYFDDWDNKARAETVQISDAASGLVLSTQTISSFQSGVYLDYAVSGHIVITITRTGGLNAVLNGLLLDPTSTAMPVRQDATTQGTWIGTYGAQGYDIVAGPVSLPAGDTVTPSGQSTYIATTTSSDPRALQVPGSSNRVAAVWYSTTGFSVDVNLGDGLPHDLELYFLDWLNKGRAETVQISDAASGLVLSTQTISSFQSGVYLDYAVSGHIVITITRTGGLNAVLNGLLLDPTSTAMPVRQDATTQGTWIGAYGAQGYDIVAGPSSLPAGDTVTPSGQSTFTWTTTSSDPRPAGARLVEPRRRRLVLHHRLQRRRQPRRRALARPRAVLRRLGQQGPGRDGADQRRGVGPRPEHADDLVVPVGRVPGLRGQRPHRHHHHQDGRPERRPQRPLPRPVAHGGAGPPGRDDAGDVDRRGTAPRATTSSQARSASRPATRSRLRVSRPSPGPQPAATPAPCRCPARRTASPPSGTPPPASASTSTSATGSRTASSCTSTTGTTRAGPRRSRSATRRRASS